MRSWKFVLFFMFISVAATAQTFTDNFESTGFKSNWTKEGSNASVSTEHSASGSRAFRSYLPAKVYSNARSELRFNGGDGVPKHQTILATWGAQVAVYIPSNFQPDNTSDEVIMQYHGMQDANDTYTNPPVAIQLMGDQLRLVTRWIKRDPGTNSDKVTKSYNMVRVTPGQWHYFVLDVNWDYRSSGNGYVKVYMRKGGAPRSSDLIGYHNGPVGSKDQKGPYFKVGIYKWDWKNSSRVSDSKKAGVTYRELFYDDFRVQKGAIMGSGSSSNNAPTVSVSGPGSLTLPTNSATFTASASDSDGSISSYSWTKVSGPSASLSGKTSSKLSVSNMVAGTYQFKVTVKDNDGASKSSTKSVVVNSSSSGSPSGDISVSAGSDFSVPVASKNFRVEAVAQTTGATIKSYVWRKISGPNVLLTETTTNRLRVSSIKVGSYEFEVEVKDSQSRSAKDRVKVVVTDGTNASPTVSAGSDKTISQGSSTTFTASASDSDGSISSYKWTKVSGPSVSLSNTGSSKLTVNSPAAGEYVFKVTVTDNKGATASDNVNLSVGSSSGISVNAGKDMIVNVADKNFRIEASADTPNATVSKYQWTKISGPNVLLTEVTTYKLRVSSIKVGSYEFQVKITDSKNRTATDRVKVVVSEGATSMASNINDLGGVMVRNFTTKTDSIKLIDAEEAKLKVDLKNVNGVKVSIEDFDGELNTEVLRQGMYQYNVIGEDGITLQKGTILIY